jgi:hypothetical protein
MVTQSIYDAAQGNVKFFPILLDSGDRRGIPLTMRPSAASRNDDAILLNARVKSVGFRGVGQPRLCSTRPYCYSGQDRCAPWRTSR